MSELIREAVASHFNMCPDLLVGKGRKRKIARPRQIAMALTREITGKSLPEIGRDFGRDHTTVLHAVRTVQTLCSTNDKVRSHYHELRQKILYMPRKPTPLEEGRAAMAIGIFLCRLGALR
jgi:chromosomal replication initiator protein